MIKIEIKNRWTGEILFEYSKENNTIKETLLEGIKQSAKLRGADLRGANLYGADLSGASLIDANLRSADLSGTKLGNKNIFSISQIGSSNRMTTFDADNNIIWCGCFTGTIELFEEEVRKTHVNNERHLHNYLQVIAYFKSLKLNTNDK